MTAFWELKKEGRIRVEEILALSDEQWKETFEESKKRGQVMMWCMMAELYQAITKDRVDKANILQLSGSIAKLYEILTDEKKAGAEPVKLEILNAEGVEL